MCFIFYTVLKVTLHLQLLQNIGYILRVAMWDSFKKNANRADLLKTLQLFPITLKIKFQTSQAKEHLPCTFFHNWNLTLSPVPVHPLHYASMGIKRRLLASSHFTHYSLRSSYCFSVTSFPLRSGLLSFPLSLDPVLIPWPLPPALSPPVCPQAARQFQHQPVPPSWFWPVSSLAHYDIQQVLFWNWSLLYRVK